VRTEVRDLDKDIVDGLHGTEQQQLEAIKVAYDRYARPLASFIRESVAPTLDKNEVATAVNNTFLGIARYAARGRLRRTGALSTLLFEIARRKAYDELRYKSRSLPGADPAPAPEDDLTSCQDGMTDEEFAEQVGRRLAAAPEISDLWKAAMERSATQEIIRIFRLWIAHLPRLQRKVAEALLLHFGDVTNREIADEIAKTDPRPAVASVKSARKQIADKFKYFLERTMQTPIETKERTSAP
jgi:DNA-directed RNA polymerase specialized sigma24 family protein